MRRLGAGSWSGPGVVTSGSPMKRYKRTTSAKRDRTFIAKAVTLTGPAKIADQVAMLCSQCREEVPPC